MCVYDRAGLGFSDRAYQVRRREGGEGGRREGGKGEKRSTLPC